MDLAHFRCPCGETISGERVVDFGWIDRVRAHKARCVLAAYEDTKPPFYFRRVYSPSEQDEVLYLSRQPDGTLVVQTDLPKDMAPPDVPEAVPLAPDGLVIYGRAIWPEGAEDRQTVLRFYQPRGMVFSQCFSVQCAEGEVGSHPQDTLTEISREEFLKARSEGWR